MHFYVRVDNIEALNY